MQPALSSANVPSSLNAKFEKLKAPRLCIFGNGNHPSAGLSALKTHKCFSFLGAGGVALALHRKLAHTRANMIFPLMVTADITV